MLCVYVARKTYVECLLSSFSKESIIVDDDTCFVEYIIYMPLFVFYDINSLRGLLENNIYISLVRSVSIIR